MVTSLVHVVLKELQAEKARSDVISREMQHRTSNLLTMVAAIARQTLRASTNLEDGRKALDGRLVALARAQEPLAKDIQEQINVSALVSRVLEPFNAHALQFTGDAQTVASDVAIGLALVLHELATNAVKYGAWSALAGHVEIELRTNERNGFMQWVERDGPAVSSSRQTGSGSVLMRTAFMPERGTAMVHYEPRGVIAQIEYPVGETMALAQKGPMATPAAAFNHAGSNP